MKLALSGSGSVDDLCDGVARAKVLASVATVKKEKCKIFLDKKK